MNKDYVPGRKSVVSRALDSKFSTISVTFALYQETFLFAHLVEMISANAARVKFDLGEKRCFVVSIGRGIAAVRS